MRLSLNPLMLVRNQMSEKSILDNRPVDDKAFPLQGGTSATGYGNSNLLPIVGHCPQCGAPVYGKICVTKEEEATAKYSCKCFRKDGIVRQNFGENKEHK